MKKKKDYGKFVLPALILIGGAAIFLNQDTAGKKQKILDSPDLNFTQKSILKNFLFDRMDLKSINVMYNLITDKTLTSAYRSGMIQNFISQNSIW